MAADRRQGGFTLIEVLVAFAIVALSLAGFFQVFSTGLSSVEQTGAHVEATLIAQSKLAAVGTATPISVAVTDGRFDKRFNWRTAIRESGHQISDAGENRTLRAYDIEVTVSWGPPGVERSVSLATTRLVFHE